jgi:hypothetical protein
LLSALVRLDLEGEPLARMVNIDGAFVAAGIEQLREGQLQDPHGSGGSRSQIFEQPQGS